MRKIKMHRFIIGDVLLLIGIFLFIAGCAGITPQEQRARDSVTKARAAFEEAKANPKIASVSAVPLYEAEQTLKEAELVGDDAAKKEHLAYMSERKTQLAVVSAERTLAEQETLNLSKERNQLILQRREMEISKANLSAKEKAVALEKARMEAKQTAAELEQARMETEQKTAALEKARMEVKQKSAESEQKAAELAQLKTEMEELKARPTDRGMVVTLGDILFATNRAILAPGAEKDIDQLGRFMKKYPTRKIVIEGHTDSMGRAEYNLTLSKRRADAVKKALVAKGIDESRIETKGYGETSPVASNKTAAGRQQNRRVEVIILEDNQSPK